MLMRQVVNGCIRALCGPDTSLGRTPEEPPEARLAKNLQGQVGAFFLNVVVGCVFIAVMFMEYRKDARCTHAVLLIHMVQTLPLGGLADRGSVFVEFVRF